MRHEQVRLRDGFDIIDVAELWPRPDGSAASALGELECPATPAVPDLPAAVGRGIVCLYAALILIFFLTMGFSGEARFMITISGLYVGMFLGVPRLFLAVEKDRSARPGVRQFLREGIQTQSGRMSGVSALAQIFAVPLLLTFAILAIGGLGLWILP